MAQCIRDGWTTSNLCSVELKTSKQSQYKQSSRPRFMLLFVLRLLIPGQLSYDSLGVSKLTFQLCFETRYQTQRWHPFKIMRTARPAHMTKTFFFTSWLCVSLNMHSRVSPAGLACRFPLGPWNSHCDDITDCLKITLLSSRSILQV